MLFSSPHPLGDQELAVVRRVEDLRERLRLQLHEPRRWAGSLRRISFARAIQGSNSIEGFVADLDDVAAAAIGEEPLDATTETTLALRGYREAMTYVLQLADEEPFSYSEQLIKGLHFMMTGYTLANRPGRWRTGSIYVRDGATGETVYEGPDISEVPGLVRELCERLDSREGTPPMIRAALAHLNLVMIHPFRDGNGRMARCLQTLVLAREGVLAPQFCSIEEYLGRHTDDYYAVLSQVGKGSWHPENDTQPWIRFILTAHFRQAQTLLHRVRESEQLWVALERLAATHHLHERMLPVLFDAAIGFRIRRSTYLAMVSEEFDLSEQSAGRDLRLLVERGLLLPHGEKRGRHYTGSDELRRMWSAIREKRARGDMLDPFGV